MLYGPRESQVKTLSGWVETQGGAPKADAGEPGLDSNLIEPVGVAASFGCSRRRGGR